MPASRAPPTLSLLVSDSNSPKTSTWRAALALAEKDFRSEWRTRAAWNAIALFSLGAPVALGYALAGFKLEPEIVGGLLWTTLFFAALVGLPRAFVKEEESGTATLLRLHYPAQAVLWGKALGQLVLLLSTQIAAVPLFVLLLKARIEEPSVLLLCLLAGDVGLALASCVLGAIAAQSRSRGALFPALAAPLFLPMLASLSVAGGIAFGSRGDAGPVLTLLFAFDVALASATWILWEFVWE